MKKTAFMSLLGLIGIFLIGRKFTLGIIVFIVYLCFFALSLKRKNKLGDIIDISMEYSKKSKIVLLVFIFVGALTASWIASGTIPGIIYYGIKFINPQLFLLFSFIITSIVAVFLGSSFGAASTIGVALMAIARSGGLDESIVGGTILAGIYFGDRWSPLSSSANLVSSLTEVNIYSNLKNMIKSTIAPFVIASGVYLLLSKFYPLNTSESNLTELIEGAYNLDIRFVFIPLISIIVFSLLRINVRISMGVSITLAFIVAVLIQEESITNVLSYIGTGFYKFEGTALERIIKGGGITSMLNASALIIVSCSLVGIFEQLKILNYIKEKIKNVDTRAELFRNTILVSIITGMVGANQTISVIMTEQIVENVYDENNIERIDLAKDIENTAIVIPGIIPWSIACYVPCTMLEINSVTFIPYAVFTWMLPICTYMGYRFFSKENLKQ